MTKKLMTKYKQKTVKQRVLDLELEYAELARQLDLAHNLIALERQASVMVAQELRRTRDFLRKAGTE